MPYEYDENGRRVAVRSKGERREQAILDAAEVQLREVGAEAMTVESIATAAGITRAALYRYFRSKNDVLAALVQRAVHELASAVATSDARAGTTAAEALQSAILRTADLWRRHGAVMRAAVDLTPTVPVIAHLWVGARDAVTASAERIASQGPAGLTDRGEVAAAVRMLVGMTERAFYDASAEGRSLDDVATVSTAIWRRALLLSDGG